MSRWCRSCRQAACSPWAPRKKPTSSCRRACSTCSPTGAARCCRARVRPHTSPSAPPCTLRDHNASTLVRWAVQTSDHRRPWGVGPPRRHHRSAGLPVRPQPGGVARRAAESLAAPAGGCHRGQRRVGQWQELAHASVRSPPVLPAASTVPVVGRDAKTAETGTATPRWPTSPRTTRDLRGQEKSHGALTSERRPKSKNTCWRVLRDLAKLADDTGMALAGQRASGQRIPKLDEGASSSSSSASLTTASRRS